jgi:two-component system OmpR family response regulator
MHDVMSLRVLLIDDDVRLGELLTGYFGDHDVSLATATNGAGGLDAFSRSTYDAVLLDVMMPGGMDGLEVLRRIRDKSRIPVLMLTARGDEADRVVGLELGADDYVPKPFSPRELLARLRAVLRRSQPEATSERIAIGGVEVDVASRTARVSGELIDLTGLELDLLVALMRRAGRVVPREALLSEAGREDVVVSERTVDVHVSHLRKKLGDDPKSPKLIRTVRGVGYVFVREVA